MSLAHGGGGGGRKIYGDPRYKFIQIFQFTYGTRCNAMATGLAEKNNRMYFYNNDDIFPTAIIF